MKPLVTLTPSSLLFFFFLEPHQPDRQGNPFLFFLHTTRAGGQHLSLLLSLSLSLIFIAPPPDHYRSLPGARGSPTGPLPTATLYKQRWGRGTPRGSLLSLSLSLSVFLLVNLSSTSLPLPPPPLPPPPAPLQTRRCVAGVRRSEYGEIDGEPGGRSLSLALSLSLSDRHTTPPSNDTPAL